MVHDLKNRTGIAYEIDGRYYEFICNSDAPVGEIYDATCYFKAHVFQVMKEKKEEEIKERPEALKEKDDKTTSGDSS